MRALVIAVLVVAAGCRAAKPAEEPHELVNSPPQELPGEPAEPAAPGLQSEYTGQAQPTLTIVNDYAFDQYFFLDGSFLTAIPSGGNGTFDVSTGQHHLTASDSMDINDNAGSTDVFVEPGYAYTMRLFAMAP